MRTYRVALLVLLVSCGRNGESLSDVEVCKRAMAWYYSGKGASERAIAADRLRCEDVLRGDKWMDVHMEKIYRCIAAANESRDALLCERSADSDFSCEAIKMQKGHEAVDCAKWPPDAVRCYLEWIDDTEGRMRECSAAIQAATEP